MYDLKDLKIEEIAFVDKGAGKGVRVRLYKRRKETEDMNSKIQKRSLDEILTDLGDEDAAIVLAAIEEAKAPEETVNMMDDEEDKDKAFDYVVEGGNKGDVSQTHPGRRDYEKSQHDARVAKALKTITMEKRKLEDRIAKMEAEKERESFRKMAESYPNVPTFNSDDLGDLLMQVNKKLAPDMADRVERFVKSVNQICSSSRLFSEAGLSGSGSDSATAFGQAEEISKRFMKEDPTLTRAGALNKAWEQNPELRKQYRTERRNGGN